MKRSTDALNKRHAVGRALASRIGLNLHALNVGRTLYETSTMKAEGELAWYGQGLANRARLSTGAGQAGRCASAHNLAADLAHQRRVRPGFNGLQVEASRGQQALAPVHVQLQGKEQQAVSAAAQPPASI